MTDAMQNHSSGRGTAAHHPRLGAAPPAWPLEEARARFIELVRQARDAGPQRVTVRGQDAVVVLSVSKERGCWHVGGDVEMPRETDLANLSIRSRTMGMRLHTRPHR